MTLRRWCSETRRYRADAGGGVGAADADDIAGAAALSDGGDGGARGPSLAPKAARSVAAEYAAAAAAVVGRSPTTVAGASPRSMATRSR